MKKKSFRAALLVLLSVAIAAPAMRASAACTLDSSTNGESDAYSGSGHLAVHFPAIVTAADECVVWFGLTKNSSMTTPPSPPGGWARQWCAPEFSDGTRFEDGCWFTYGPATGTEGGTSTGLFGGPASAGGAAFMVCATGCYPPSPVDPGTSSANSCGSTGSTGCTIPAATLAAAGDLAIVGTDTDEEWNNCGSSTGWTLQSGFSALTACAAGGNGAGGEYAIVLGADEAFASSGSTGDVTMSYGGHTAGTVESMIALQPFPTAQYFFPGAGHTW